MNDKRCAKCKQNKAVTEFYRNRTKHDGRDAYCRPCRAIAAKQSRLANLEKRQERDRSWSAEHAEQRRAASRRYYARHKDKYRARYERDRAALLEQQRRYREVNREKARATSRRWYHRNPARGKQRLAADPQARLANALRKRLNMAVRRGCKAGSAVADLGCTIAALKVRFEAMFEPGMTWENYGDWHIDHIVPLVTFDLTDRQQLLRACHYTNLQPLWREANLRKGAKIAG